MIEKYLLKNGADVVGLAHNIEDSMERVTITINDNPIATFSQGSGLVFPDNAVLDEERKLLLKYVRSPEGNYFSILEGDRRLIGFSILQKSPRLIGQVVFWYQLVVLALYAFLFFFSGQDGYSLLRVFVVLGAIYALVVFVTASRLKTKPEPKRFGFLYRLCFIDVILTIIGTVLGNSVGLGLVVLLAKVLFLVYFSRRKNVFSELVAMGGSGPM